MNYSRKTSPVKVIVVPEKEALITKNNFSILGELEESKEVIETQESPEVDIEYAQETLLDNFNSSIGSDENLPLQKQFRFTGSLHSLTKNEVE